MSDDIEFEATFPDAETTYTEMLTLSEKDRERISRYLRTILNDNPMARYVYKLTTGGDLDINPLRTSKYIDIIKTTPEGQETCCLSEHQAQNLAEALTYQTLHQIPPHHYNEPYQYKKGNIHVTIHT